MVFPEVKNAIDVSNNRNKTISFLIASKFNCFKLNLHRKNDALQLMICFY